MVISAAGMAICLLCGGCAGKKAPDAEWNMGNETVSEDEVMENTFDETSDETDHSDVEENALQEAAASGDETKDGDKEVEIEGLFTSEPIPDEVFEQIGRAHV